jgi:Ni,Fe-hydrogenase III large subunit
MTEEQITQYAIEVGIEFQTHTGISGRKRTSTCGSTTVEVLQAFATVVRNATLEDAALKCNQLDFSYSMCEQYRDGNVACECAEEIRSLKS